MRLSELIDYTRGIPWESQVTQEQRRRDESPADGPNATRIERQPPPPWVTGDPQPIRDRGDLIVGVEHDVPHGVLPSDIRQPNPPIDTLAYYLPFHLHERNWGIYVRESGIIAVAFVLNGSRLSVVDSAFQLGRQLLLAHERMHFQAEVACARAEVVAKLQMYKPYFDDGFAAAHEEALANAHAYQLLGREPPGVQERAAIWMKSQGPGYRDFERWVTRTKFAAGCRRASQHMLKRAPLSSGANGEPAEFLFDAIGRFKPPTYFVRDVGVTAVLKPFPYENGLRVLVHTRDHPPPHIHIRISRDVDFTKYLWPQLKPVKGQAELSVSQTEKLWTYLRKYGPAIYTKVRDVYPGVAPLVGAP